MTPDSTMSQGESQGREARNEESVAFHMACEWRMRNAVGMGKATGSAGGGAIRQKGGQGEEFQENEGWKGLEGDLQEIRRWGVIKRSCLLWVLCPLKASPDLDLGILGERT